MKMMLGVCESVGFGICVDIDISVISNHSIMAALYWHRYNVAMADEFQVITGDLSTPAWQLPNGCCQAELAYER